jgi:thiamine pyrophosphate-dependent acetolactate synthase large subunit-like protein
MYGRPGAVYVDISGDMVNAKVDRSRVRLVAITVFHPFKMCTNVLLLNMYTSDFTSP